MRLFRSFYTRGRAVDEVLGARRARDEARRAVVGKLSGGQKQRLAIACALVGDPELLFLDEPTTGLDPQSRRQLWSLLERFRAGGGTILLTTHYMDEAEALCDRVAIVDQGKVIALGTPRELIRRSAPSTSSSSRWPTASRCPTREALRPLPGVPRRARAGHDLRADRLGDAPGGAGAARRARRPPDALALLTTHSATLEDVFVRSPEGTCAMRERAPDPARRADASRAPRVPPRARGGVLGVRLPGAAGARARHRVPQGAHAEVVVGVRRGPRAAAAASSSSARRRRARPRRCEPRRRRWRAAQRRGRGGRACPAPPPTYRFDPTRPESRAARLVVDDALQRAAGRTRTSAHRATTRS